MDIPKTTRASHTQCAHELPRHGCLPNATRLRERRARAGARVVCSACAAVVGGWWRHGYSLRSRCARATGVAHAKLRFNAIDRRRDTLLASWTSFSFSTACQTHRQRVGEWVGWKPTRDSRDPACVSRSLRGYMRGQRPVAAARTSLMAALRPPVRGMVIDRAHKCQWAKAWGAQRPMPGKCTAGLFPSPRCRVLKTIRLVPHR